MKPTDISAPDYFHKVVDCQWACPAHTPVPEYIRLIAEGRYSDAYMINWKSNVFPGILGRTCDRPCEPACRRGRVEENPVAICRLKRVAADFKDDVRHRMPKPVAKNGKRVALVGGGPASLAVARDLAPLGYHCTVFDADPKAGGMMRSQIPKFRLPDTVIDEETDYILNLGVEFKGGHRIESLKKLLAENYDAVFIGSGAPRGRDLDIPGRKEAAANIHIGIEWLASVSFGHIRQDRQARHRARRRQHRDGLLPHRAPARRRGRQGDRAFRLRGDEGERPGKRKTRSTRIFRSSTSWSRSPSSHRGRQAHRRHLPEGEGRIRRQGPPQSGAVGRAGRDHRTATTCWSRSARRMPSPGSSATAASSSTSGTCRRSTPRPSRRAIRRCSSAATRRSARRTSSGRWRTATTPRCRSTRC